MAGYGWDEYDIRHGGHQTIHDAGNNVDITTEFVKIPGGEHGGSWGVRIKGIPREDAPPHLITTILFYAGMEGFGRLNVKNEPSDLGIEGEVVMEGSSNELGGFTLQVTEGPDTNMHPPPTHKSYAEKPMDRTMVSSMQVPEENIWQAKCTSPLIERCREGLADLCLSRLAALIFSQIKAEVDSLIAEYGNDDPPPPWAMFSVPNKIEEGNFHVVQKVFDGPFEV